MDPAAVGRTLGELPDWRSGFSGASLRTVVRIKDLREKGTYYFLALYERPVRSHGDGFMLTGMAMFDIRDDRVGAHIATQAVRDERGVLPRFLTHDDVLKIMHGAEPALELQSGFEQPVTLGPNCVVGVGEIMIWRPCEQSRSPFLPFHEITVKIPELPELTTAFLRSDGVLFPALTRSILGS